MQIRRFHRFHLRLPNTRFRQLPRSFPCRDLHHCHLTLHLAVARQFLPVLPLSPNFQRLRRLHQYRRSRRLPRSLPS